MKRFSGRLLYVLGFIATATAAAAVAPSLAQESQWPSERPIRLIVPFQAGSFSDVTARTVSQPLAERLGQQIVVENRVGAAGMLGTEAIARAEPDGYALGFVNTMMSASATALHPKPPYDAVKDFTPVVLIGSSPFAILAAPNLPVKSIADLIALAKAKPGALNYASSGPGSMAHLVGALLEKMAGIRMTHVPYRGTAQSSVDLMEGRIELLMGTIAPSLSHIRAGKIRALATTGSKRNPELPDVPTVAEQGIAGYEAALAMGYVLPARAPVAIVERINREVVSLVKSAAVTAALNKQGVVVETSTSQEFGKLIRRDSERWTAIIREVVVKPK
jgi:tripartite-type tricarboxylate transporter receptor subunit TctC